MKIVFSTDGLGFGGKERQISVLSNDLLNKGVDIYVVCLKSKGRTFLNEYCFPEERIIILNRDSLIQEYIGFVKIIKKIKPDILFTWDIKTSFYCLISYKKYKFDYINGSIRHGVRLFKKSHIIRSLIAWNSPYVVANSKIGLQANNLKLSNTSYVLYNGIDNKFRKKNDNSAFCENLKSYDKVFISVANLLPIKDYFTILKALKFIKEKYNFYYYIIGEGPLRSRIESLIDEYGLSENIELLGYVKNISEYLRISDVMIHSSRGEGISNAILEAMFVGLPIIASDVGGVPETVYYGSSLLFPYQDVNKLISCLDLVFNNGLSVDYYSEEYQSHLDKFTVKTMVKQFYSIINEINSKR